MSKTRYKFTGIVDSAGNVIATSTIPQRYISVQDLRRLGFKKYINGREMTFEIFFDHRGPAFEDHTFEFVRMLNIRQLMVM